MVAHPADGSAAVAHVSTMHGPLSDLVCHTVVLLPSPPHRNIEAPGGSHLAFQDSLETCYIQQSPFPRSPMDMLMIAFRTSLRERVHEILRTAGVMAYTEFPGALGTGQSGSTEGISFYAGGNSVILVSLESAQRDKVADAVKAWCAEAQHSGWVKPAVRVFCWPCTQLI